MVDYSENYTKESASKIIKILTQIQTNTDWLTMQTNTNQIKSDFANLDDKYRRFKIAEYQEEFITKNNPDIFNQAAFKDFRKHAPSYYGYDATHYDYTSDRLYGDLYLKSLSIAVDLKVGDNIIKDYAGSISLESLKDFTGWFLTCSPSGSKLYLMNAAYLRFLFKEQILKLNYRGLFFGESNYSFLVDNKNIFCIKA